MPAREPPAGTAAMPVLEQMLAAIRQHPSRTWSLIVTVYGDAIVPRGGSVWLGTLYAILGAMGVGEGVVRTAMSRLAGDGWLERSRVGRNSYYRLADKGRETFAAATRQIYFFRRPHWTGGLDLVLPGSGADAEPVRTALREAGFGTPLPGLWIAPPGRRIPQAATNDLVLRVEGSGDSIRDLAARSWSLGALAASYDAFIATFAPLRTILDDPGRLGELDALVVRIVMIHEFRRIVLRDPVLPEDVLPSPWAGQAARELCADLYRALLPASERWLDRNAIGEDGLALPPTQDISDRFRD